MPAHLEPRPGLDLMAIAIRHATLIRLAYLAIICTATLLNLGFDPNPQNAWWRFSRAFHPAASFKNVVDAIRNVALFAGWGATWILTTRGPATRRDIAMATLLGMLASISVESLQAFSVNRETSALDVLTNTLGGVVGAVFFWLVERRAAHDMRGGTTLGVPGWMPASALLVTAASLAFAPSSRPSFTVAWDANPLLRMHLVAVSPALTVPWMALSCDAGIWGLAGLAVAIAISDRAGTVRWYQLAAWLVIVPLMVSGARYGRSFAGMERELRSLPVQAGAVALGLLVGLVAITPWRRRVPARSQRAMQLTLGCMAVGMLVSWIPADWAARRSGGVHVDWRQLVPMYSLFLRQDMSSVFLVLQKAGLGAAIGACLAARKRSGAPQPGVRAAVAFAVLVEVVQVVVPGRYPDVTDILITGAAAGLAAVLVSRASHAAQQGPAAA